VGYHGSKFGRCDDTTRLLTGDRTWERFMSSNLYIINGSYLLYFYFVILPCVVL
jgi:hypothetical protein